MTTTDPPSDRDAHRAHLAARSAAEQFLRRTLDPTILNRIVSPLGPDHDGTVLDEVLAAVEPGRRVEERILLPGMRLVQYSGSGRRGGPPEVWWFGEAGTPSAFGVGLWYEATTAVPALWIGPGSPTSPERPTSPEAVKTFAAWRGLAPAAPRWFVPRPGSALIAA